MGDRTVVLLHAFGSSGSTWDAVVEGLAGYGVRTITPDLVRDTLDGMREEVVALLDAAGLERVDLVGHSMGGAVAWLVAGLHPERVGRLVIEDTPPPPHLPQPLLGGDDLFSRIINEFRTPDPGWWARLPGIAVPTLLIYGGAGSHVQGEALAEVAAAVPDCRLVTIEAGHRVHSTLPAEFQSTVEEFLGLRQPDGGPRTG